MMDARLSNVVAVGTSSTTVLDADQSRPYAGREQTNSDEGE